MEHPMTLEEFLDSLISVIENQRRFYRVASYCSMKNSEFDSYESAIETFFIYKHANDPIYWRVRND